MKMCCNEAEKYLEERTLIGWCLRCDDLFTPFAFCPFCGSTLEEDETLGRNDEETRRLLGEPLTIVFDIDGLICKGGVMDYSKAEPYPHAIAIVNRLYYETDERGKRANRIVLQTARYMSRTRFVNKAADLGRDEAEEWLSKHRVWYDQLLFGKSSGALYVDDRGCRVESARGMKDWENNFFPALRRIKEMRRKAAKKLGD